jgi:hypothetical protein
MSRRRWFRFVGVLAAGLLPVAAPAVGRAAAAGAATAGAAASCPGIGSQLAIGVAMVLVTAAVHSVGTVVQAELGVWPPLLAWCAPRSRRRLLLILITVFVIAAALLLDILLWALLYRQLGVFAGLEPSLYFSGVTFTTVGYGDITLPSCWRLLAVMQAVNGVLMAGWGTAQLVYGVQRTMELRLQAEGRHR